MMDLYSHVTPEMMDQVASEMDQVVAPLVETR